MTKITELKIKLFLEMVDGNKWCYNKLAREKIREHLKECDLLKNGQRKKKIYARKRTA